METQGLPGEKARFGQGPQARWRVCPGGSLWWQTVWHDVEHMALTPRWKHWGDELLLPLMYWTEQLSRTRCPGLRAKIALALKTMQDAFVRHPCTQQTRAPTCWQTGKRGPPHGARTFRQAVPRRLKVVTAICHRCSRIIAACPSAATRCGPYCTTKNIVAPQMAQRQPHGFLGGCFLISLRAYYRT